MTARRLLAGAVAAATAAGVVSVTGAVAQAANGPSAVARGVAAPNPAPGRVAGADAGKDPVARGSGGAVSSVDPTASRVGIQVLRRGGNAVDAAVATAATLGVTEPYSAGIGGGGFFVFYDASTGRMHTLDGRETAPQSMPRDAFIDPDTGNPYPFFPDLVTSGVSVGVPGTLATWQRALARWGTNRLPRALRPATDVARDGFVVDPTFRQQTLENKSRFRAIIPTRRLFLPGGDAPPVGSVFRNPDLARTYELIAERGTSAFYDGPLTGEMVRVVQDPPADPDTSLPVPPGFMRRSDVTSYDVIGRPPTHVDYRGFDVFGMAPPSSGGSTVGEGLQILENFPMEALGTTQFLHRYLEASAIGFADRAEYVGDPAYVDVPLAGLLSEGFGAERSCLIRPERALKKPIAPGEPDGDYDTTCAGRTGVGGQRTESTEGTSTTHLSVVDQWGNVVAYTLTIEQTGGSGITVPGRGFLLNNELTDFSLEFVAGDPNRIQGGKRPRSSMSPTIVMRGDRPWLVLGSPGGTTIITTVLQLIVNRVDRGMTLPEAIADPRATQNNLPDVYAEQEFIRRYGEELSRLGHSLVDIAEVSDPEIGAVAAIEFLRDGRLLAAAEPERRGGGSAMVVCEISGRCVAPEGR